MERAHLDRPRGRRVQRLLSPMATQFLPPLDRDFSRGGAVDAFFALRHYRS